MARGDVVGDIDGATPAETRGGACDAEDGDALGALDALHTSLDCPICGTWFSAPLLLTVCGHSFCAACIRENFDYQERTTVKEGGRLGCPLCRKACAHRDLVANLVLRDVVAEYEKAEAGLRRRLERAEAREEEIKVRESVRHAKRRRKKETGRMNDVAGREDGGGGAEEGGTSPDVVCLDEEGGSDEGRGPCSLSPGPSEDDACSSGEEYDPRRRGKRGSRGTGGANRGEATAGTGGTGGTGGTAGPGTTASSFVACPICGKNVHHMYMNSHIDACLVGGGGSGSATGGRERATSLPALDVPPKLVLLGALNNSANEKKLKNELKKYNISTEGCASARELLDRYMRFRTAVEVSNDKGEEGASYEKIVFRMMKEERSKKMAGMFGGRRSARVESAPGTTCPRPSLRRAPIASNASNSSKNKVVIDMTEDVAREAGAVTAVTGAPTRRFDPSRINLSEIRHPREILLPEDASFEELVAVTRLRDRVRLRLLNEFHED